MSHPSHFDVVVVGGGPGGASTAFALARAGVRVCVLDRAHFPRSKPCAEYLSPQASRLLDDMGVLDSLEQSGAAQLAGMIVRAPNGALIRGDFVAQHGYSAFRDRGLAIRRTVLDAALIQAAARAGAEVREGVRVADVVRAADGRVTGVRTVDGALLTASQVVGADGLRSVIGRRTGLAKTSRFWARRIAIVAHFEGFADVGAWGEMHVERSVGYVGFASVGNGLTNVSLVIPESAARDIRGNPGDYLLSWLRARPQLAPRVRHARQVSAAMATGPFASHARRAWAPGAALVGDAADFFDPFTGEGIYTALRGGELLAPALLQALGAVNQRDERAALKRYERARRHEFRGKWIVERLINAAIRHAPAVNYFGRTLSARKDMADLLVGVTGDFVPAREVLRPRYILNLFRHPLAARTTLTDA
jgi:geranylgeranyl reductase family protein